jgi:hypothetical protein
MVAITGARPSEQSERAFFLGMILLTTAIVLWGFAPSFFLRGMVPLSLHSYLDPPLQPIRWLYIAHGLVFTVWVALGLTQAVLVASGRTGLHRRLGRIAFVLAPALVVMGLAASGYATVHGFHDAPLPAATFSAVPLFSLALYSAFVTAGLAARRQPQAHKRWMLFAMIVIAAAGWDRIDALNPLACPPGFRPSSSSWFRSWPGIWRVLAACTLQLCGAAPRSRACSLCASGWARRLRGLRW